MLRPALLTALFVGVAGADALGQRAAHDWQMVYTPSHRATYTKEWKYRFPDQKSTRWFIALRYPPKLAWSRDVTAKAELLTGSGWKPFREVTDGSAERRRMLVIDLPHDDPKLRGGFTVRTSLAGTIYHQQLRRGRSPSPPAPLSTGERDAFLAETDTFDFGKPNVKAWMDAHRMWIGKGESHLDFAHRVYKELRRPKVLPYDTKDGGEWVCSQILRSGFGECCRHAIVGTSILRANKVPARTVCGLWAIDDRSKGGHCWGEFFMDGVGWVPYDTTLEVDTKPDTEAHFGAKKGEVLAGMVDFDWVIDAGPFGRKTVFAIDAFPAFWSAGEGNLDNSQLDATEGVRIPKRPR